MCSEHTPSGTWECDCERGANQLPSVTIEFANESTPITLSPSQYMVHDGSRCLLGFFDSSEMGMWLLGDRFLVNRYVVYDYDHCESLPFACSFFACLESHCGTSSARVGFSAPVISPPSWLELHWHHLLEGASLGAVAVLGVLACWACSQRHSQPTLVEQQLRRWYRRQSGQGRRGRLSVEIAPTDPLFGPQHG